MIADLKLFSFGFNGLTMLVDIKYLRKKWFFGEKNRKKADFFIFGLFLTKISKFRLALGTLWPPGRANSKEKI